MAVAAAKMKEPIEFNITDVLDGAASTTSKKTTKSNVPVVAAPDDLKATATTFREKYEKLDSLKIKYLYFFPGGSLYQPIYLCERDDISDDACVLSQLKYKPSEEE
jgi:hypothetical protein